MKWNELSIWCSTDIVKGKWDGTSLKSLMTQKFGQQHFDDVQVAHSGSARNEMKRKGALNASGWWRTFEDLDFKI
jgi:hypothetical protein